MDREILMKAGIDYEKGVARFMGDWELYEMVLEMFLNDDAMDRARKAFDECDYRALFMCAHEMKGACGNADMFRVAEAAGALTELLRGGAFDEAAVEPAFMRLVEAYEVGCAGIRAASMD